MDSAVLDTPLMELAIAHNFRDDIRGMGSKFAAYSSNSITWHAVQSQYLSLYEAPPSSALALFTVYPACLSRRGEGAVSSLIEFTEHFPELNEISRFSLF